MLHRTSLKSQQWTESKGQVLAGQDTVLIRSVALQVDVAQNLGQNLAAPPHLASPQEHKFNLSINKQAQLLSQP